MAFDGTQQRFGITGPTYGSSTTIAFVANPSSNMGLYAYLMAGASNTLGFISQNVGSLQWLNGSDLVAFGAPSGTVGVPFLVTVQQVDGVSLVGRLNGVQVFSQVPVTALSGRSLNTIGSTSTGTNFHTGSIAEFCDWGRILSAGDLGHLEHALGARYGIAIP